MLIKAINWDYLKGCPNLTAHGISKYLNLSPAMVKGHMKCTQQGIHSTCAACTRDSIPNTLIPQVPNIIPDPIGANANVIDFNDTKENHEFPIHDIHANIIESDEESDGNAFVFAAFADK